MPVQAPIGEFNEDLPPSPPHPPPPKKGATLYGEINIYLYRRDMKRGMKR